MRPYCIGSLPGLRWIENRLRRLSLNAFTFIPVAEAAATTRACGSNSMNNHSAPNEVF